MPFIVYKLYLNRGALKKTSQETRCQESWNGEMDDKKKIQTFKDHDLHLSKDTKGLLIRSNSIWLNWTNEVGCQITK